MRRGMWEIRVTFIARNCIGRGRDGTREIPRPAGENAGLGDDAFDFAFTVSIISTEGKSPTSRKMREKWGTRRFVFS